MYMSIAFDVVKCHVVVSVGEVKVMVASTAAVSRSSYVESMTLSVASSMLQVIDYPAQCRSFGLCRWCRINLLSMSTVVVDGVDDFSSCPCYVSIVLSTRQGARLSVLNFRQWHEDDFDEMRCRHQLLYSDVDVLRSVVSWLDGYVLPTAATVSTATGCRHRKYL